MIISDRWKEPVSKVTYVPTGKELPVDDFSGKQYAYWMLAGRIEEKFGGEPVVVAEVYHQLTGPLGLTSSDTIQLVRAAKKEGYLK